MRSLFAQRFERRPRGRQRELPTWLGGVLVLGTLGVLLVLERRRPLREPRANGLRRDARNLGMAALGGAVLAVAQTPIIRPLTRFVARRRIGLLGLLALPEPVETLLAIVLMDYSLYGWHYLTHRSTLLWRFHEVHHLDVDLSVTTAIRFHFGELLLSVPWRAAQVVLFGITPRAFSLWQTATIAQILFHHSNVRLPEKVERWLCRVIVTPRMHGIHHSVVRDETDSNWSTIFSFFDRLHGTLRLNVPQAAITIGVPAYPVDGELGLGANLALPFRADLHEWTRPGQDAPERPTPSEPQTTLVP